MLSIYCTSSAISTRRLKFVFHVVGFSMHKIFKYFKFCAWRLKMDATTITSLFTFSFRSFTLMSTVLKAVFANFINSSNYGSSDSDNLSNDFPGLSLAAVKIRTFIDDTTLQRMREVNAFFSIPNSTKF